MVEPLRILILEDVPSDAALVEHELCQGGLEFVSRCVETEPEYLAALDEFKPDVILSDYKLPSFNGMAALRLAQERAPAAPFIIVTGTLSEEIAVECIKAGAADYVLKDRLTRLSAAVRGAIERQRLSEDKRRAEEALRESEERYRSLFEAATDGIAIADIGTGKILDCNPALAAMVGRSREELIGQPQWVLYQTENLGGELTRNFAQHARGPTGSPRRDELTSASGARRVVEIRDAHLDLGGRKVLLGIFRDLSELRRAKDALEEALAWQQHIFEGSRDAVFISDEQARFVAVNCAATELTGFSRDELLAMRIPDLHDESDLTAYRTFHQRILAGERILSEAPIRRKDGSKVAVEFNNTVVIIGGTRFMHTAARDITERRRAEEALRLRDGALAAAANAIVITDADGRIEWANPAFTWLTGYELDDARGQKPPFLTSDLHDAASYEDLWRTITSGAAWHGEMVNRRKDGTLYSEEMTITPVRDAAGTVTHFIAVKQDVTERKRAEDALRASEDRYRTFVDSTSDLAYVKDENLRYMLVNKANQEFFGKPETELLGRTDFELMPREAAEACRRSDEEALREGHIVITEERVGGKVFETHKFPLRLRDGKLGVGGVVRDVTDRSRAAEVLRASEERFRALFENAPVGYQSLDVEGRLLEVNRAWLDLLGYAPEEVIGRSFGDFLVPAQVPLFEERFPRFKTAGAIHGAEFDMVRKDGGVVNVSVDGEIGRDTRGAFQQTHCVLHDMTARKHLEEQVRHSQKMEAVGRLAGGVAHDFNNLLQAMLSLTQVLLAHRTDPDRVAAETAELEQQVKRGAALTRQLLLFSRRETTQFETLDVNEVVREADKLLRRLLKANVAIELRLPEGRLPVEADRGQLDQVLVNLAVNSEHAMPEGGRLTIATGSDDKTVWLQVADTGSGIAAAIRDHIFEPFFTTKGKEKGTGLGLSVVHGIVAQHGGAISFESREGEGTTFTITLPRAGSGEHMAAEIFEVAADAPRGRGESILVVEDEEAARSALADLLTELGYQVTAVGSSEDAEKLSPLWPFDLLLTDLMLPGVGGGELAMGLQARWPELRVVLMSGYTKDEAVRLASRARVVRFLQKPFDMTTLARELRAALDVRAATS